MDGKIEKEWEEIKRVGKLSRPIYRGSDRRFK
jgi:hypothetical protein